jgi:hypothetical protein
MFTSDSIVNIMPALLAAQAELRDLTKDTKGYGYNYATLDQLLGQVRPVLNRHGLFLTQDVMAYSGDAGTEGDGPAFTSISTALYHVSGEYLMSNPMTMPVERRQKLSEMQCAGMNVTYSRRYQLQSMLGITAEEDTDAAKKEVREEIGARRVEAVRAAIAPRDPNERFRGGYPSREERGPTPMEDDFLP